MRRELSMLYSRFYGLQYLWYSRCL
jgi:hypothetical protein